MKFSRIAISLRARSKSLFGGLWRRIRTTIFPEQRHNLLLVKSTLKPDGWVDGPHGHQLYFSSFNPDWFAELRVEPHVILDVGSFDGGDALVLKTRFPDARVVAVEADPQRAKLVREALEGTGIEVVECAVLDSNRTVDFYSTTIDGQPSSQGSIFQFNPKTARKLVHIKQAQQSIQVKGRTLSDIFKELKITDVSLLHMDIQGAEFEALLGLGQSRPHMIHLEVGNEYRGAQGPSKVHNQIISMGYSLAADFINDRLYVLNYASR
jgi:FkbM family methyltransferase